MDKRTFLIVAVTFILTTLFWFSVPTVSMIIQGQGSYYEDPTMEEVQAKIDESNTATPNESVETNIDTTNGLTIAGTWVFAKPQTSEEREHQLIFNEYGIFKYYDTNIGFTLIEQDYSVKGNRIKIGYDTGNFKLSNENGVDYLEIYGFKKYSGKLKRLR